MVRIFTDSTCDLTPDRLAELGVKMVPLTVFFADASYLAGVELSTSKFYEKLRDAKEIPTTAQPTPAAFEDAFRQSLEAGEEIVGIFIGDRMSGTVQSATIAKQALNDDARIHIINSETVCLALGLLVEIAADLAKKGENAQSITETIESLKSRARIYAAVETLEYLKKGGRLSATSAVLGTMLNIHPLVTVQDGLVQSVGKARGRKGMMEGLRKLTVAEGIDLSYPVLFGHADAAENLEKYQAASQDLVAGAPAQLYGEIGAVVGTHAGPGIIGIAYIRAK